MLPARLASRLIPALSVLPLAACGTEDVSVTSSEDEAGAVLFADHCAGCHTLTPAGTQGSGNRSLRVQGPNLDQRAVPYEDALFAIRNGGASGAVMPQNIVAGVLAALLQRERTGRGQMIETSLVGSEMWAQASEISA